MNSRLLTPVSLLTPILVLAISTAPRGDPCLAASSGAPAWADTGQYHWPCEVKPSLSSSFGEFRPGRFHAGIDLRTNGKTGYKIFAVADGHIYRMRMSPHGYGKALYLRTDSGLIAVYAHLSGFVPELEEVARQEQGRLGQYSFDLRLRESPIPVRRGQVLGWTGQTGIGAPHLHFELRRGEGEPINPQTHGFPVPDRKPPDIRDLVLIPVGAEGRIEGSWKPRTLGRTAPLPLVSGKFGVGVRVSDGSGFNRHVFAPFFLELFLDDVSLYRRTLESFRYDQNSQILLEYHPESAWQGDQVILLFRKAGNSLPGRMGSSGLLGPVGSAQEVVEVLPGRHRLRVEATDVAGNMSAHEWEFEYVSRLSPGSSDAATRGAQTNRGGEIFSELDFEFRDDLLRVRLRTDRALSSLPVCVIGTTGGEEVIRVPFQESTASSTGREFERVIACSDLESGSGPWMVRAVGGPEEGFLLDKVRILERSPAIPGHPISLESPERRAAVHLRPSTLYEPVFVGISVPEELPPPQGVELETVGIGVRIDPPWGLVHAPARLEIAMDRSPDEVGENLDDNIGLYWYNSRRGTWSYCSDQSRQDSTFTADIRAFGTYGLFADRVAPAVGELFIDGTRSKEAAPTSLLSLSIDDEGSGLYEEGIVALLDGERVIAEWDPERKLLRYRPWGPFPSGDHVYSIEISDRAGNRSRRDFSFSAP